MNATTYNGPDRLTELLVDEATAGLSVGELDELDTLLTGQPARRRNDYMHAAAVTQLAFLKRDAQAAVHRMPAALRARILSAAAPEPVARGAPSVADLGTARARRAANAAPRTGPRWFSAGAAGWYAAAALVLALVLVRTDRETPGPQPVSLVAQTLAADDHVTAPWNPPTEAGYEQVRGSVTWSDSLQTGFMRLSNLPVNDPATAQYQLWIIDPERDANPVDGGVFDVSATGEVIVPIHAKLAVSAPQAFAITLEQPGGVVVSDGPLLVVAALGG